jgi:hypothetical protein
MPGTNKHSREIWSRLKKQELRSKVGPKKKINRGNIHGKEISFWSHFVVLLKSDLCVQQTYLLSLPKCLIRLHSMGLSFPVNM